MQFGAGQAPLGLVSTGWVTPKFFSSRAWARNFTMALPALRSFSLRTQP
jgi:hypothetical protein